MPYKDKAKQAAWYREDKKNHPEKYRAATQRSKERVRRLHRGSTPLTVPVATIDAIWEAQGRRCAICKTELEKRGKFTCMDHNHSSLKLRGVLCSSCNLGIGQFKEDIDRLLSAVDYLRRYAY